ncbi:hypothetical protein [Thermoanaerobacterium sp. DL9XJH110]|uniref:hypothetical protein n=1 Tax=Thermoanaerobacterium sp. DL9XJH110 TaxID=3386643 RepID=UPI003BB4CC4D
MVKIKLHLHLTMHSNEREINLNIERETPLEEILVKIGVPEDEVGIVVVNGIWQSKTCTVEDGDSIELFPYLLGG